MGTEVLRPQDPMAMGRFCETSFHRRRHLRSSPYIIVDRRPCNSHNRRREVSRKTPSPPHVTILKRGESLDSLAKGGLFNNKDNNRDGFFNKYPDDTSSVCCGGHKKQTEHHRSMLRELPISGTRRIGTESAQVLPKQIKLLPSRDVYAGSAFSLSPSPRSLPLPSFFGNNNKVGSCYDDDVMFVDSATIGLRRLLRLD